jgi:hypothetical protein
MTTEELLSYRKNFIQNFETPTILSVTEGGDFKNAEKTGDRDAHGGVTWINYWRAITNNYTTIFRCSSCGKEIVVGEPTSDQKLEWYLMGEDKDDHKAEGGHIWLTAPDSAKWKGGRYITPLCPACNAKRGQQIYLREGSILCKEVGAN